MRLNILKEIIDRYPDLATRTLARVVFAEVPELYPSIEIARSAIRSLRGTNGRKKRKYLNDKKYVRQNL